MNSVAEFGAKMRSEFVLEPGSTFVNHGSYGAAPHLALDYRLRYVSCMSLYFRVPPTLYLITVLLCGPPP